MVLPLNAESRFWEWKRMKMCPFSWLGTSQTWMIDGRLAQTKQRHVLNSGACAMWRHRPKPVPTWIRFVRLGFWCMVSCCVQGVGITFSIVDRCSSTWWERYGREKWKTAKRRTGRRKAKVWPRELESDAVFYSGKSPVGVCSCTYTFLRFFFSLILCPYLTITLSPWPTGHLTVCQGVVRWHHNAIYNSNFQCADTPK